MSERAGPFGGLADSLPSTSIKLWKTTENTTLEYNVPRKSYKSLDEMSNGVHDYSLLKRVFVDEILSPFNTC